MASKYTEIFKLDRVFSVDGVFGESEVDEKSGPNKTFEL